MSQWKSFWKALSDFPKSVRFISKHQLQKVYAASLLVAFALAILFFQLRGEVVAWLEDSITGYFQSVVSSDGVKGAMLENEYVAMLTGGAQAILNGALHLMVFWIQLKLYKPLVLVALSPIMAWMMEHVLSLQGRRAVPFRFSIFIRSLLRGLKFSLFITCMEWAVLIAIGVFGMMVSAFIPVLGFLLAFLPAVSFLISAWFYGAAIVDYAWELKGVGATQSVRKSWKLRGGVLGVGMPLAVFSMIPIVSLGIGPVLAGVISVVMGSFLVISEEDVDVGITC